MSLKKYKNLGISCFVAGAMILGGLSFFQPAKVYADNTLPQTFEYKVGDMGLTVGDQGGTQLCWAYTSSKVLETLIYNATTPNTAVNISEDWISLAYMYYVNDENQSLISEGKSTDDKTTYLYGQTGIPHFFQRVVNAYGLMFEEDFTFTETVTTQNYKEIFETSKANASKNIISNIAPFWVGGIAPYATQNDIVNTIKDYLYNNGAVYTAVNSITSFGFAKCAPFRARLIFAVSVITKNTSILKPCDLAKSTTSRYLPLISSGSQQKLRPLFTRFWAILCVAAATRSAAGRGASGDESFWAAI